MANDLFTDPDFLANGMNLGLLYHVGIVVNDIDQAIERYGAAFGIKDWRSMGPMPMAVDTQNPASHGTSEAGASLRWAYTINERFPWLEFLQPIGGGDWALAKFLRERGEGIHHLGYFVDDISLALKQAEERGIGADLLGVTEGEGGAPASGIAYLSPKTVHGISIELVSLDLRQTLVNFVKTGEWPGMP